jgi:hypothetical protein
MEQYELGKWIVEIYERENDTFRVISDEEEMVILDNDKDMIALFSIGENGNINLEKVPWNSIVEFSFEEKKIIFSLEEETEF